MSDFDDDFEIEDEDEEPDDLELTDEILQDAYDELEGAGFYTPGISITGLNIINDIKGIRGITFTSPVDAYEWITDVAGPDYAEIVYFGGGLWGVHFFS